MKTTAGHVLLDPIYETRRTVPILNDSGIFDMTGESIKTEKNEVVHEAVPNQGIVRILPEHTINNEKIGCKIGDRVLLEESAGKIVVVDNKEYLKVKYREIMGVMKESPLVNS